LLSGFRSDFGSEVPQPDDMDDDGRTVDEVLDAIETAGAFLCEVTPDRDVVWIAPQGELDLATAPVLDAQLQDLADAGFEKLVLDLRELTFVDSTGVHLLIRWTEWAGGRDDAFRLIAGPPRVMRVLEMTGVRPYLRMVDPGAGA
jgi:anti-sigma B factor antagonist